MDKAVQAAVDCFDENQLAEEGVGTKLEIAG